MSTGTPPPLDQALATLRQFARPRPAVERCELCSAGLAHEHPHLVEPPVAADYLRLRRLRDALRWNGGREIQARIEARSAADEFSPDRRAVGESFNPDQHGVLLSIEPRGRIVTLYPSPAGPVESLLPLDAWNEIVEENAVLAQLRPDIEALLVNRVGHAHALSPAEYYIAPIDECYKLVGLIRANWKGLSGGSEVWVEIGRFFSELRSRADVISEEAHA